MADSTLGFRLLLMLGPIVPLPASRDLMTALSRVEVTCDEQTGNGFQIVFQLKRTTLLDYDLLLGGRLDLFTRVTIGVVIGITPEILINGVITHHELAPAQQPGMATLTVTGRDILQLLDLEEQNDSYPVQPDSLIVMRLLAKYARHGLVPEVTPTTDVPLPFQRIPCQCQTDAAFIQHLARRNGFVFYLEPLTVGVTTAYWGRANRPGIPQPALRNNMGAYTNVSQLSFSNDALAPANTVGQAVEPISRTSVTFPPLPPLKLPPLVTSPTLPQRTVLLRDTAKLNPLQAVTAVVAAAILTPDAVSGTGELNAVRYGRALRPHRLIGVQGAGRDYDGNYYVSAVTHIITPGAYTQRFRLRREGTGALLPVVRPA
jgi:hypothetical protein